MDSPLLAEPGAVPADGPDTGVAAHYGDPYAEQRATVAGGGVVDVSHRDVIRIGGPDRLSWLHSLTTQQLEGLAPGDSAEALILDHQGHVQHAFGLTDDGEATWAHTEPGAAGPLLEFLASMRFMLRVEPADLSESHAVLAVLGPGRPDRAGEGGLAVRDRLETSLIVPRDRLAAEVAALRDAGAALAGTWAREALRIAAGVPRLGLDTDHRTIPHEMGWIDTAVHLSKGCYRGQETVARVHNLGHPPRRLVRLLLDGSEDRLPGHGDLVTADGTEVGFTGSAARHYELGPVALAVIRRTVPVGATLQAAGIAAAQEVIVDPDAGGAAQAAVRQVRAGPARPAGLMLRRALLAVSASTEIRELITTLPVSRDVVTRFVAGDTADDVLAVLARLAGEGLLATVDYLGEEVASREQAAAAADEYIALLGRLGPLAASAEVSVKPTAVGLGLAEHGQKTALENIVRIAVAARNAGTTVTLDMEDHTRVEATLRLVTELRADFPDLGCVLQSYLRRTEADCAELAAAGARVRLCKGAYEAPGQLAGRHEIDRSYARCMRILMRGGGYPMLATHDPRLIELGGVVAAMAGRDRDGFEYQMLYGLRPAEQRRLAAGGARVRVYVPYGSDWYGYLVRRLAERPASLAFFLRALASGH